MRPLDPLTVPLRGRVLIEASAGTGKTYTIGLLLLRLLLERELPIDQILVVTYTRAATAELRGRLRQRIREFLDLVEGRRKDTDTDELLVRLRDNLDDPGRAATLLRDTLARMDEAAVFTIHGFCQRILQEYPLECGLDRQPEFIESEQLLRIRIIEDYWRRNFYDDVRPVRVAPVWDSPDALLRQLDGPIGRPDIRLLPLISRAEAEETGRRLHALFTRLADLWREQGEEIHALLLHCACLRRNNSNGYGPARLARAGRR